MFRETQYDFLADILKDRSESRLGLFVDHYWRSDPRRLLFAMSRYKFVAKLLTGTASVLEIGCADGFLGRLVKQEVGNLTLTDFDPVLVDYVNQRLDDRWPLSAHVHDFVSEPFPVRQDAIYSLDVLEHIELSNEPAFMRNVATSLQKTGIFVVGTPSIESQAFASTPSREGHVNCKSERELRDTMEAYFERVFLFSMNDEVIHTGFGGMAHYRFAVGVVPRVS